MNGTNVVRVPRFLEGENLPPNYFETPDPYSDPPASRYNVRAMVNYALRVGKKVTDLTKEEADQFRIKSAEQITTTNAI